MAIPGSANDRANEEAQQVPQLKPEVVRTSWIERQKVADPTGATSIKSSNFAATISAAGIRSTFKEFQNLLVQIYEAVPSIHAYASGEIFAGIFEEFYTDNRNPLANQTLFGDLSPDRSGSTIAKTRASLRRITNSMELIRQALALIEQMDSRVSALVENANADFINDEPRTENLIAWAYRKGAQLNPEMIGKKQFETNTNSSRGLTDIYGLLVMFDSLTLELETLLVLPAYYRTATSADTSKIETPVKTVFVRKNESIERISARELGSADRAHLIMEFNDLEPMDILGENWDGMQLKIPYLDPLDTERVAANFVLDAQQGVQVLGRDLPNTLDVVDGDLTVLNYTNTFMQGLDNILQTPLGAIAEDPDYGNNILTLEQAAIPQIVGSMLSPEVTRALMTDPRVKSVSGVVITKVEDAIKLSCQVTAINHQTEAELKANLD